MYSRLTGLCALLFGLAPSVALAAGGVQVESSESGASIYVDGADTGMETPGTVMGLSDGRHVITVRDGCNVGEATVEIAPMKVLPVRVVMKPAEGVLTIQPVPLDAVVALDGERLKGPAGQPQPVSCGVHTVQATLSGYLSTMLTVDVEAGQQMVLPVELERLGTGGLRVDVTPNGAMVLLDGKELGTGDREVHGVVAGPHVLAATLTGFASGEQQFILEDGETLSLSLDLKAGGAAPVASAPSTTTSIPAPVKEPRERAGIKPTKVVGYGLIALGAGSGALALTQWSQGRTAYADYLDRADLVKAGEQPPAYATEFYDQEVRPFRGPVYGATTAAALLLGSGVTLAFVF